MENIKFYSIIYNYVLIWSIRKKKRRKLCSMHYAHRCSFPSFFFRMNTSIHKQKKSTIFTNLHSLLGCLHRRCLQRQHPSTTSLCLLYWVDHILNIEVLLCFCGKHQSNINSKPTASEIINAWRAQIQLQSRSAILLFFHKHALY
jgi:hypothetical protein